jgi:hypothetical protein
VDGAHAERGATPHTVSAAIQPLGHLLDAERTRASIPVQIQAINQTHQFGLDRIDVEFLLDLLAPTLGLHDPIAERRRRAVPKALLCRFTHGPRHILYYAGLNLEPSRKIGDPKLGSLLPEVRAKRSTSMAKFSG